MCLDKILSKTNLHKRGWFGSLHCNICGYPTESTLHIFLRYNTSRAIWDFILSNAHEKLSSINITEIFTLYHAFKFNISFCGWNTLVLAIVWTLWLNRIAAIFRNQCRDINSIFHHILLLTSCWTDVLTVGHDNSLASMSQTLRQIKQDWDCAHPMLDNPPISAPTGGFGVAEAESLTWSTSVAVLVKLTLLQHIISLMYELRKVLTLLFVSRLYFLTSFYTKRND